MLQGPPPWEPFPEVVGITVHLTFAERAYALARWYRQRGAKVILGGLHVTSCPDEARPHADAMAIGEGVQLWGRMLDDVAAGTLAAGLSRRLSPAVSRRALPRREILDRDSYLTTGGMISTRGCHNRCGFCYLSTRGLQMPSMARDIEQVAAEIRDAAAVVCRVHGQQPGLESPLLALPLPGLAAAGGHLERGRLDRRDRRSRTGARNGLGRLHGRVRGFRVAGESQYRRRPEEIAAGRRLRPASGDLSRYGMQVNGSFVFGFDHDRPDVFAKTVAWIEANRLECATFHILTPYPGTPLFAQMEAEGRLLHRTGAATTRGTWYSGPGT